MGSISMRKRKDGSSYLARVRVMRERTSYHEAKSHFRGFCFVSWRRSQCPGTQPSKPVPKRSHSINWQEALTQRIAPLKKPLATQAC